MAVRPPPYHEQFGTEADQDANSLLTELDKGDYLLVLIRISFYVVSCSLIRSSFIKDWRAM